MVFRGFKGTGADVHFASHFLVTGKEKLVNNTFVGFLGLCSDKLVWSRESEFVFFYCDNRVAFSDVVL